MIQVMMFLLEEEDTRSFGMLAVPRLGEEVIDPETGTSYNVIRVIHYPKSPKPVHIHLMKQ